MNSIENAAMYDQHDLHLTQSAKAYLVSTAKWSYILSITGLVLVGIFTVVSLGALTMFARFDEISELNNMSLTMITPMIFAMLFFSFFYIYPLIRLYKFSVCAKAACALDDAVQLELALKAQKALYAFIGIVTFVVIGIYLLVFIFAILFGLYGLF